MILQGNTYRLPIQVKDSAGNIITPSMITKAQFVIGDYEKFYEDGGEVGFDKESNAFIVPLTEEETFALRGKMMWQVRFVFLDGSIDGTIPRFEDVSRSITDTIIGGV